MGCLTAYGSESTRAVFVNQVRLSEDQIQALEALYSRRLSGGHFWYDKISGLWGMQGGPAIGQILPGLNLVEPLRVNASDGNTGVFINGREIHLLELQHLQMLFGQVYPGRYWVNAQGIGGLEGGPPLFNLNSHTQGIGRDWIRRTLGGTIGSGGSCFYYNHPNGSGVMTGSC